MHDAGTVTIELGVTDIAASRRFYRDILGFQLVYDRPEDGFESIVYEGCVLMLDQIGTGRTWATASLKKPLGRGLNIQLQVSAIAPLLDRLAKAGIRLFVTPETRTYRTGNTETTQRQFCVQDPDGYLLRFCETL